MLGAAVTLTVTAVAVTGCWDIVWQVEQLAKTGCSALGISRGPWSQGADHQQDAGPPHKELGTPNKKERHQG